MEKHKIINEILNPYFKSAGFLVKLKMKPKIIADIKALIKPYTDNDDIPNFEILSLIDYSLPVSQVHAGFRLRAPYDVASLLLYHMFNMRDVAKVHGFLVRLRNLNLFEEKKINMIINHPHTDLLVEGLNILYDSNMLNSDSMMALCRQEHPTRCAKIIIHLSRLGLYSEKNKIQILAYPFHTIDDIVKVLSLLESLEQKLLDQILVHGHLYFVIQLLEVIRTCPLDANKNIEVILNLDIHKFKDLSKYLSVIRGQSESVNQTIFNFMTNDINTSLSVIETLSSHDIMNSENFIRVMNRENVGAFNEVIRRPKYTDSIKLKQDAFDVVVSSHEPKTVYAAYKNLHNKFMYSTYRATKSSEILHSKPEIFSKIINALANGSILTESLIISLDKAKHPDILCSIYILLNREKAFKPRNIVLIDALDDPSYFYEIMKYLTKTSQVKVSVETALTLLLDKENSWLLSKEASKKVWQYLKENKVSIDNDKLAKIIKISIEASHEDCTSRLQSYIEGSCQGIREHNTQSLFSFFRNVASLGKADLTEKLVDTLLAGFNNC